MAFRLQSQHRHCTHFGIDLIIHPSRLPLLAQKEENTYCVVAVPANFFLARLPLGQHDPVSKCPKQQL